MLFHVSVHNVSFTETNLIRCRDICNNDNIEHKSRIVTNFSTKDVSIRLCYIYDQLIFIQFPNPRRPFIRLFHLSIIYLFLFTKFVFALIYFYLLYFINLPLFIYTLLIFIT